LLGIIYYIEIFFPLQLNIVTKDIKFFSHISELVVTAPAGDPLSALSDLAGEVKGEPS
jgi:hypothetical protein